MYTKEEMVEEFWQSAREMPAILRGRISEEEWNQQQEERLKQREEFLKRLLETIPDYFQLRADLRNGMDAYNKASEAGDEAALPELDRRVRLADEKLGCKFDKPMT